jgi:hypothetical protein
MDVICMDVICMDVICMDVIDCRQESGQAVRDVRGGKLAVTQLNADPSEGTGVDTEDPHADNDANETELHPASGADPVSDQILGKCGAPSLR